MIIGERIKARLDEKGLSQSKLARLVGVDQSTINGLIRGGQRSSSHLHRIARFLDTTPAYLSGETDDPYAEAPVAQELSSEVRDLIGCYEALPTDQRKAVLTIVQSMAKICFAAGGVGDEQHTQTIKGKT